MIGYHYRKTLEAARILRDERKAERMFDDSGDTWVWRVCALLAVVAVLEWFAR